MSLLEVVNSAVSEVSKVGQFGEGVYVNSLCMYPSGGFVRVVVYGQGNTFTVSDDGGAVRELESTGRQLTKSDRAIAGQLKDSGLSYARGAIKSPICNREELPVAIALVANCSKSVADWLFDTTFTERDHSLAQPPAGQAKGWQLVPVEPTQEMVEAWAKAAPKDHDRTGLPDDEVNRIWATADWQAMLAAAPSARHTEQG